MKYIKKVVLENFQSHKYTEVEFDSRLNIIVGDSDSGKTAIFRGIKWVLYNEPLGDFFIREGSNSCKVTIVLNDQTVVERFRSKSKNSYHLYLPNEKEAVFEGFGHNVPYEISKAIGIQRINLDKDRVRSVNLSEQLDGAFLLSESGSIKASSIGRLVGVNIIDDALRKSLNDSRRLTIENNSIQSSIIELKEELSSYDYLEDLEKKLQYLKNIREKINIKIIKKNKMINLFKEYKVILLSKEESKHILIKTTNIKSLQDKINEIQNLIYRKNNLSLKNKYYLEVINNIRENKFMEKSLKNIELSSELIKQLNLHLDNFHNLVKSKKLYIYNRDSIKSIQDNLSRINKITLSENKYHEIENKYRYYKKLIKINSQKKDIEKRLKIGNVFTNNFKQIDKIHNINFEITKKTSRLINIKKQQYNYLEIKNIKNEIIENIEKDKIKTTELLTKYKMILSKQETCPLCFSSIDEDRINNIIKSYEEDLNYEL